MYIFGWLSLFQYLGTKFTNLFACLSVCLLVYSMLFKHSNLINCSIKVSKQKVVFQRVVCLPIVQLQTY